MGFQGENVSNSVKVFDPRENEDFSFGPYSDGSFVSSVSEQVLVTHIPPSGNIISLPNSLILNAILTDFDLENGVGFISTFATSESIEASLPDNSVRLGQGILGYFPATISNFEKYFSLFKKIEFGELTIGCAEHNLVDVMGSSNHENKITSSFVDFDLLAVVSKIRVINWLVSFYADTGDSVVVSKLCSRVDSFLEKIKSMKSMG